MRDPAREKQRRVVHIARIEATSGEEIAGVVERHQHHYEAPQEIDGIEPRNARCGARRIGAGLAGHARNGSAELVAQRACSGLRSRTAASSESLTRDGLYCFVTNRPRDTDLNQARLGSSMSRYVRQLAAMTIGSIAKCSKSPYQISVAKSFLCSAST